MMTNGVDSTSGSNGASAAGISAGITAAQNSATQNSTSARNSAAIETARASIPAAETAAWGRASAQPPATQVAPAQITRVQAQVVPAQQNAQVAPPTDRELAALSAAVYDPPTAIGRFSPATPAQLAQLGINPAQLTSLTSTFQARVYVTGSGADMQAVVAMRGTQSGNDWQANFRQAAGLSTDHYARALDIGRTLAQNGITDVTFTGHSLGGGLAAAGAIASGSRAVTFNAAGLSQNTINQAQQIHNANGVAANDNVTAYNVRGDLLTYLQDHGDRVAGGLLGRFAGGLIGGLLGPAGSTVGGMAGSEIGRRMLDAPEAYGNRIALDSARPDDHRGWASPIDKHGIDFVEASMDAAGIR